eukprot:140195-Amphidinium_carterae.2
MLSQEQVASLESGDRVLVKYQGFRMNHERLLGCHIQGAQGVVVTPDGDNYDELFCVSDDMECVRTFCKGRQLPRGSTEHDAYLYYDHDSGEDDISLKAQRDLMRECKRYRERHFLKSSRAAHRLSAKVPSADVAFVGEIEK